MDYVDKADEYFHVISNFLETLVDDDDTAVDRLGLVFGALNVASRHAAGVLLALGDRRPITVPDVVDLSGKIYDEWHSKFEDRLSGVRNLEKKAP